MRTLRILVLIVMISGQTISLFANDPPQKCDTTIYTTVDKYPTFSYNDKLDKDGICEFYKDSLRIPQFPDCMGSVIVKFIVEKNGMLTSIKITREIPGCNEYNNEALRVVRLMNGFWKPATRGNESVRFETTIPVIFNVTECEDKK
jgi:TonB family protein